VVLRRGGPEVLRCVGCEDFPFLARYLDWGCAASRRLLVPGSRNWRRGPRSVPCSQFVVNPCRTDLWVRRGHSFEGRSASVEAVGPAVSRAVPCRCRAVAASQHRQLLCARHFDGHLPPPGRGFAPVYSARGHFISFSLSSIPTTRRADPVTGNDEHVARTSVFTHL